ncbi:hypothetical protein QBC47DRAFT_68638 [Echria macrotheca]|uniref:Transmembrane protein n=1 Tax=Echria macrotheca TaxID=438768 RepID=A0AAJ0B885_9PEZI|nr:hypothetical protein QBC47DRAFT_68638 [Echria macrotheca]
MPLMSAAFCDLTCTMANRPRLLSSFSLSILISCALASSDELARAPPAVTLDAPRGWPQQRPDGVAGLSSVEGTRDGLLLPRQTSGGSPSAAPCAVTPAPAVDLYRRQLSDQAVTIVFLSSELASANGNSISMSRSMASSISQLQLSVSLLSSSASSAILALQASASRVLQAVEASASDAVSSAEESASSRVSEILASASLAGATVTAVPPDMTTYQAQTLPTTRDSSVSVAVVAGAVVASVVGSAVLSILGFYFFVYRRRAKREERDEQKRKEEEVDVNAALDRAIVSYIAKESPTPTTPNMQGIGTAMAIGTPTESERRPSFLVPPPLNSPQRPRRPTITIPSSPPPRSPAETFGSPSGVSQFSTSPLSPQRSATYSAVMSSPPGPPPKGPLPQLPKGPNTPVKSSRRNPSSSSLKNGEVYNDIIIRPLEVPSAVVSPSSPDARKPDAVQDKERKRNSNWPLPGIKGGEWV